MKKTEKRTDIILWQYIFLCLRVIDSQLFTCSIRLKNCCQEQEISAKLTCETLRVFSVTIIPYSCTHERMGRVEDGFEPPLLSYFLGPCQYQNSFMYWLYSPGNYCSAHEGIWSQQMMQPAHEHKVLTGEEAEGAPKKSIQPKHLLVSLCCGVSQSTSWAPEGALHSCWDTEWIRINKSLTHMSLRRCSSGFIVQFYLHQLKWAGKFYFSLGGWGHILAMWHTLLFCWYFRNSLLFC